MILHLSTWQDIEAWLKLSKTIIIPIGSNEQHGPTGLLGTDWLCPEIIAHAAEKLAEARGEPILIAPTFNIGMAQHHLGFSGTISLRPSTFMAAIEDWIISLSRHGFERIYFLNGHGGNVATIEATFSEVYSRYSYAGQPCPFVLKLANWWDLHGIAKLCGQMFPMGHGSHATPSEIAITWAAYPDRAREATLTPRVAPMGPIREALDYRARFPDGRIGSDPTLASIDKGQQIIDAAIEGLLKDVAKFSAEIRPS